MSEVQSRPSAPRGRGSARGGRAGFGSRGGRGGRGHATNGDKSETTPSTSIDDDGEVSQLKKQYGSKVGTVKELFPDWTDEDVVFALQETDGDLETTVERISEGSISQWGEVSKNKKDRSRSKAKEPITTPLGDSSNGPRVSRGGRGGQDGGRGGRGRGNERGRGGRGRGAPAAHINGTRAKEAADLSVPTEESPAWDTLKEEKPDTADTTKPTTDTWGGAATEAVTSSATAAAAITSSIIPEGVKKSWASMFKTVPVPKKEPAPAEKTSEKIPVAHPAETLTPAIEPEIKQEPEFTVEETATPTEIPGAYEETDIAITPSKDELTETNLEQVLDTSNPPPTATAASTVASSWDPRSGANSSTPYSSLQGQPQANRPPVSGFAASAQKATGPTGRTPSYQRRVLDQEEAVRMPGNREVDRAAVQFGAFNLGTGDEDVDGDREEPETRAQPPQHSPVAPRASLPPAPVQSSGLPDGLAASKEATGLPASTHTPAAPGLPSPLPGGQSMAQEGSQGSHQYGQYGRYGQPGAQDQSSFGQKPYDPFSQQAPSTQSPYEGYPSQQNQPPSQQSSAPSEYSQYYTADQQRNAYQNYYGQQYGQQQSGQSQPEGPTSQQRSYGGYNAPPTDASSPFPQTSSQQSQSRYAASGEAQTSGHTTPNPPSQSQQQVPGQAAQSQPAQTTQPQGQPGGQYPYGHPYYSSPYYAAYMNQYQQGYGGNYAGGPYGGKGGMYNQPHQGYGMSPQTPYDHAASPAGAFGQTASHGRDSTLSGGLSDYGRTGSQPSQAAQPLGASGAFGGMQDAFGRGSSYQGQGQQYGQQGGQQGAGDDLKPFGDGKSGGGPSPSLSQAARPGSAATAAPGQPGLPPTPSTQQGGYGGYPSHLQQQHSLHGSQTGSQYAGLGGLGGHQAAASQGHQSSQYGGYGQGQGFGNSYYNNNQQQRGGWGNNYQH